MPAPPTRLFTPEEYLKIERDAPFKSEYHDGILYAMAGAREAHNLIAANSLRDLAQQLRSRPCRVYGSDMRVRTPAGPFTYPDLTAVCDKPVFLDQVRDTLLNPALIIEVLSPSTEAYDRGKKFELYGSIASLREYLMLASDRMHADLYVRQSNGQWLLTSLSQPQDEIVIQSIDCRLKLADLYEKVEFDALL